MTSELGSRSPDLALGAPRFADPRVARLAQTEGLLAAWQATFAAAPSIPQALATVSGRFAVGLNLPDGRTVIATDRFAIQGLCYRVAGGALQFDERADALAGADTELDLQALFDYLYFHVIPAPRTIFQNVWRLPAGHVAVFQNGQLEVAAYWTPSFRDHEPASFGPLREEFLQLMREAVEAQLDGSKPACFLSGGTDSSTVTGMIQRVAGQVDSYSIGFDAAGYDEMEYARIAAKQFGSRHHEYYVTPDDLVASIPQVAAHYDQPFGNSSALPAYYCAKMARADGVNRILAGDGGDELFGGNTRYAKQRVFDWYQSVPAALRSGLMEPFAAQRLAQQIPGIKKAASYVNQAKVPMPDRMMAYNLLFYLGVEDVLTPAVLRQVDRDGPAQQQKALWPLAHTGDLVNRMLAFDWRYTLADCDIPKVVGTTQLAGVAVGFPLLDDRIVAFSERLPAAYKLKGLRLRWFFKEALRGFLPDAIITKKKQGFGLPFGVWTAQHPRLKQLATDSLHRLADRGIVHRAFVERLLNERLQEHAGYYGEMIWILMMLEQWLSAKRPQFRVA